MMNERRESPAPASRVAVVEDEDEGAGEEVARWEGLLPRMPVRVMLVEGDDSTRQIIAALLRKCSYRVATISDGLKAWESLTEKPNSIDLVLTEVELPSLSGFNLLTMIMDNEAYNSIPVIMMSSHDSMSMVFKCMLRGAADFLVKPIRKNELRNLWQHVWRRQLAGGGNVSIPGHHDDRQNKHKMNDNSRNGIFLNEHVPIQQANKEYSEHGSDAQSSCTRSGMETDSEHKKMLELKLPKFTKDALTDHKVHNAGKNIQLDSAIVISESKAKEVTKPDLVTPTKTSHNDDILGQNYESHEENISSKVVDLLATDQSQSKHAYDEKTTFQSEVLNTAEVVQENDVKNTMNSIPHLELSLRRFEDSSTEKHQNGDNNALNHSYSSAFSLYSNKTVVATTSRPMNIDNKSKECVNSPFSSSQDQCSTSASLYTSLISTTNLETTKKADVELSAHDGSAVKCTPLRVIPFPLPVSGISFDNLHSSYASTMQPIVYQQPGHAFWAPVPSSWQERATHANSSYQSDSEHVKSVQNHHLDGNSAKNSSYHTAEKKDDPMQPMEETLPVSTGTGVTAVGSMCSGGIDCINFAAAVNKSSDNAVNVSVENDYDDHEGSKQIDLCRLSQREAALNKFRLKRKDRCFEKKVRYQSRKILAEQRPRVKGQFVRKVQIHSQPVRGGYFPSDSTPR